MLIRLPRALFLYRHQIGRFFLLALLAFAMAAAALLLALRYAILPNIEKYHHEVVVLASRAVGLPITIGKIEAGWRGLRPRLVFTDVKFLDEQGNTVLALRQLENIVSWMTLISRELRLNTLALDEPDLFIHRDKQGLLYVAGLKISGQSSDDKLADWLLHQTKIIVRNGRITWQDDLFDRPALVFSQVQFNLNNKRRRHRFAVQISPPAGLSSPLDIRADLVGDSFSDMNQWQGEVFVQLGQTDLQNWRTWLTLPQEIDHARGGARAWIGIEQGKVSQVTADVDINDMAGQVNAELMPFNVRTLTGRLGWRKLNPGFEVSSEALTLDLENGFKLSPVDLYLRLDGAPGQLSAAGEVRVNTLHLADIQEITPYVPLEPSIKQKLADAAPRGQVSELRVKWRDENDHPLRFDVEADLTEVDVNQVAPFPGVKALSGKISGSDRSGTFSLDSTHLSLDVPQVFSAPVHFDRMVAQASWQHSANGWNIKLDHFSAENQDVAGSAYGSYQFDPKSFGAADLKLNLKRAKINRVVNYLPYELLGQDTMAWLRTALLAGEAKDAHLTLRGDLKDFPFSDHKKGSFQVKANASGVVLDYTKGWPRVENADVVLAIDGPRLQVDSQYAMLAGATAQQIIVSIPDLMGEHLLVKVHGQARGETKHGLNFIKRSPVRTYINGFTDDAIAVGEGTLTLDLDIPLGPDPIKLQGNYNFGNNEISLGKMIPVARNVVGNLSFTESTLSAKDLTAEVLGGPATVSILTTSDDAIKIKMQGKANLEAWHKVNSAPLLGKIHGTAAWNADVSVQKNQYALQVTSNLQGVSSELPAPLAKGAQEAWPLRFELKSESPTQDVMSLALGKLLEARLISEVDARGQSVIKRGNINLGVTKTRSEKDGLWVSGTLPELSLEGWQALMPPSASDSTLPFEISGADVTLQKVTGYGTTLHGLTIHARNRGSNMTMQLASKEVNGEVNWLSQGKGKLMARFKNIELAEIKIDNKNNKLKKSPASEKSAKSIANLTIPVIDVAVDHFSYKGNPLGRLEFHASQFDKDILLDSFRLTNPDGVLLANGKWSARPAQTHLVAKLSLVDIGRLLNRSGYPNAVKNGSGSLDGDLVWSGGPQDFSAASLDGQVNVSIAKGEFLKLDTVAGKGFEFQSITGLAQIKQGILSTGNFKINGALANVNLSGQVDLGRETQNLRASVNPNVGNGVSLLAFAAGPAVGAVVFITNKILRDPLDKLASFEYNVSGSWAEPKVEKVGQAARAPK